MLAWIVKDTKIGEKNVWQWQYKNLVFPNDLMTEAVYTRSVDGWCVGVPGSCGGQGGVGEAEEEEEGYKR